MNSSDDWLVQQGDNGCMKERFLGQVKACSERNREEAGQKLRVQRLLLGLSMVGIVSARMGVYMP